MRARPGLFAAVTLLGLLLMVEPAAAQRQGGTLRIYHRDNPPSASLHEESTVSVTQPFMAVFNNLVLFDQSKRLNSLATIVPDLAAGWSWDEGGTKLTFKLREGVRWHDGKPFTAKDVQCTWHALIGKDGAEEFRPGVILIDQLKGIYIDGVLEPIDTTVWYAKVQRKDYSVGLNLTGVAVDYPDIKLIENYTCNSERNYTQYCNPEIDSLIFRQSREPDLEKRRRIVWDVERRLAEEVVRPMIFHNRAATCWHPHVKGIVLHQNSIYGNWRLEDVWLDK